MPCIQDILRILVLACCEQIFEEVILPFHGKFVVDACHCSMSPNFRNIMLFIGNSSVFISTHDTFYREKWWCFLISRYQSRIYGKHKLTLCHTHTQLEIKFCNIYVDVMEETKKKKNLTFNQKVFCVDVNGNGRVCIHVCLSAYVLVW